MKAKLRYAYFFLLGCLIFGSSILFAEDIDSCSVKLIAEKTHIVPGQSAWLGLLFHMPKGMHTYWKNSGQTGFPLRVQWELPSGCFIEEERWPAPHVFNQSGIISFGFEESLLVMFRVSFPEVLSLNESCSLKAEVEWLACGEDCMPLEQTCLLKLPVSMELPLQDDAWKDFFQKTRELVPEQISDKEGKFLLIQEITGWALRFTSSLAREDIEATSFIPLGGGDFDYSFKKTESHEIKEFKLPLNPTSDPQNLSVRKVEGIFVIYGKGGVLLNAFLLDGQDLPIFKEVLQENSEIPAIVFKQTVKEKKESASFLWLLGSAFLGGLILNVMPCVLPLIGLKVYSLIKSSETDRKTIFKKGCWFSLGVIGAFWLLALVGFFLKILGHNVGWGFQLQEPAFLALLVLVLFLFGLNCLGVFESGNFLVSKLGATSYKNSQSNTVVMGSLSKGVLATLLTTPCTGPFLGSVLGFTLTLSLPQQLLIFSVMGLGMSLPYLIFSTFPRMMNFLPKGGGWMQVFKEVTGFMMIATVVWLIGIFQSETGPHSVHLLLISLFITGMVSWMLGKWGTPLVGKIKRRIIFLFVFLLMTTAVYVAIKAAREHADKTHNHKTSHPGWEKFSSKRLEELHKLGVPVFVDFTAEWCLTCQMNKRVLLSREAAALFKDAGMVMMVADWTKKREDISEEMAKVGRAGVPTYVCYYGKATERKVMILPQRLSFSILKQEIQKINE